MTHARFVEHEIIAISEIGFDPFEHLYKLRVVLVQNDEYRNITF